MLTVEIVRRFEDFQKLEQDWDDALERSGQDSLFLSFAWISCWWQAFGRGKELYILLLKDDAGTLCGIAPLMRWQESASGLPVRKIGFIYNDNASRADFIFCADRSLCLQAVLGHLFSLGASWDMLEFSCMSCDSEHFSLLCGFLSGRDEKLACKEAIDSPYIVFDCGWDEFFRRRSQNLRKYIRSITNRMHEHGGFAIRELTDPGDDLGVVREIFDVSRQSWKAGCHRDICSSVQNRRFFELFIRESARRGWLRLWLLRLEGKAVAYEIIAYYRGGGFALRADYVEAQRRHSPGSLLNAAILKKSLEEGVREFDFCGHNEAYKKKWTSLSRRHSHVCAYNRSAYGRMVYAWDYGCVHRSEEFLKKFSMLKKLKKTVTATR